MRENYLVTSFYKALNIGDMRSFDDEREAWAYWDTLSVYGRRIYRTNSTQPPELLKEKNRPM